MTPKLARFIRLARIRIGGIVPSEQEWAEFEREEELNRFKVYIGQKTNIDVRLELFTNIIWNWNANGCSLQFSVDEQTFVLQQTGSSCRLILRTQKEDIRVTLLTNDDDFEDRLLVGIGDTLASLDR